MLDTGSLPPETAKELRRLVAAASAESGAPKPAGRGRDAMSYTVTVDEGTSSTTLTASDTAMSPAFAALLSWIERHTAQ